ncbi:unnamed protein product [Leptidea sinapis]|uniref:Uncharacterized protein n=1 Tax=Leptidea sinapis TaxID=189913 RepID=A0A5E4QTR8_9NEOP|nr:unnamed protein product [Leptidea sinapis]
MAKDDLLDDSDSSSSQKDIRSSQAGSSRKKEQKTSDFEESDEENSEPAKNKKRKKLPMPSDSDYSDSSSTKEKKKRRRIKVVEESDGSGSDTENEGKNKHGRKNIRKVMGKNQLEEATKRAAREEKERIARITERQKLYNNLQFDESGKPDEVVLDKVVLDFDPETKEPLIEVDKGLVKKLKPHQVSYVSCFHIDSAFHFLLNITNYTN